MVPTSTIAYYVIQTTDLVLLLALTGTILISSSIGRHPTIANNLILWAIQSFFACLLLYSGYYNTSQVPAGLCKVQSAIQYGAPPALSAAAVSVVARVWYLSWSVDKQRNLNFQDARWVTPVIIAYPYLVWIAVAVACGIISGDNVRPVLEYCASDNQTPAIISGATAALLLAVACVFQFWALAITLSRYRVSRKLGPSETGNGDTALFIRIAAFSIFIVIALILALVATVSAWSQVAPDIIVASIGFVVFIIFGSQNDVLEAWGLRNPQMTSVGLRSFGSTRPTRTNHSQTGRDVEHGNAHKITIKQHNDTNISMDSLDTRHLRNLGEEEMRTFDSRSFHGDDGKSDGRTVDVASEGGTPHSTPPQVLVQLTSMDAAPTSQPSLRPFSRTSADFPVLAFGAPSPSPHSWRVSTQGKIDGLRKI